jgi:DNA-binding response OmpR family regulator
MTCILVVDDEPEVRKGLVAGLSSEGWEVVEACDRKSMFGVLRENAVDLVTLDIDLAGENGFDLARQLRSERNLPILMISGLHEPFDRVRGLESGADDYIIKPFHIREVVIKIEKTLALYQKTVEPASKVLFDHSEMDFKRKIARHLDGSPLELTHMEMQLLELFLAHPGRVLSRDDISNALYGHDWSPYDRSIDGHVARLRKKIEPPGDEPTLIRSVRGVGYVFSGEVIPVEA